ncbi:MAG TPA: prolyl aminopeptidase [Pseudomonadales bacterium]|nr:prolyl aminopeptidase [Pseudomonadales bacterium]MDP6315814.1 prolyl aminopeptidase [Pseudomonadales bacterium]MDP7315811.1 prolyl aminopeptidase [Pseudomonadales bacterium]HJP50120.1 prolyl aminopeptidase [Pseudomonadales bacterium]
MLPLYPEIKPYARHMVEVGDTHQIYVDESGTAEGIPVLFVHAGPGSGCEYDSRCFFNPEKYRIILFDQRGAGRSTPHGDLTNNTTTKLVEDIEKIREFLNIDRWMLLGGGFGALLSLVYAETHPGSVLSLVMRGTFLGRESDIKWLYQDGASRFYPDHWEDFVAPIPESERGDLVTAYKKLLDEPNELARMAAAKAFSRWEADCSTIHPNTRLIKHMINPHRARARSKIGLHYFVNGCFVEENQIINNIEAIQNIPGIIVHGRYDMMCPLDNAFALHEVWPISQLFIVREAGHSATEPALIDALIRATRDMSLRFEADFGV